VDDFQDDRFLKPVLEDDALIMALDELPSYDRQSPPADAPSHLFGSPNDSGHHAEIQKRNAELEGQVEALKRQFASYRQAVEQTLDKRWGDDASDASGASVPVRTSGRDQGWHVKEKDYYYDSYAHNGEPRPLPLSCTHGRHAGGRRATFGLTKYVRHS
jgi:hypothetical protein